MKRLSVLLLFLSFFPLSAQKTSIHTVHFSFPVEFRAMEAKDSPSRKYFDLDKAFTSRQFGINANWNKVIFYEDGYTLLFGAGAGLSAMNIPEFSSEFFTGGTLTGKIGFGYAPVRSEKIILSFHGFSGLDIGFLDCYTRYRAPGISDELHYTNSEINFTAGAGVILLTRLSNSVTLFSGIDFSTVLTGFGSIEVSRFGTSDEWAELKYTNSFNSVKINPRIGLCWGF